MKKLLSVLLVVSVLLSTMATAELQTSAPVEDASAAYDAYTLDGFQYKIPLEWSFEQDGEWNVHCAPDGGNGAIRVSAIDISVMQITMSNDEIFQTYINTSFSSDTDKPFVRDEINGIPIAMVSSIIKSSTGSLFQRVNATIGGSKMLFALFVSDTDFATTDTARAYLEDFSTDITVRVD